MCRLVAAQLEATVSAPAAARELVARYLERWELSQLAETAVLLTSEIVTNAVVHAHSGPSLVIAVADGSLEIGVSDHDHRDLPAAERLRPLRPPPGDEADVADEGGRGLPLVDLLADEWGATPLAEGKQVWFRLDAGWWSHRTACVCHGEDLDRVRLLSGRFAIAIPGPWDAD